MPLVQAVCMYVCVTHPDSFHLVPPVHRLLCPCCLSAPPPLSLFSLILLLLCLVLSGMEAPEQEDQGRGGHPPSVSYGTHTLLLS